MLRKRKASHYFDEIKFGAHIKIRDRFPSVWMLSINGKDLRDMHMGTMEISTFKKEK